MIGLDIETTGLNPRKDKIVAIGLYENDQVRILQAHKDDIKAELERIKFTLIVIHNAKFDMAFIYNQYGVMLENVYCTYMASRILMNGLDFSNSLVNCLSHYMGVSESIHEDKSNISTSFKYGRDLTKAQIDYISGDIKHLPTLYTKLQTRIAQDALDKVVDLELKLLPVILRMEAMGVRIDEAALTELLDGWKLKTKELVKRMDLEVSRLYGVCKKLPPLFVTVNYGASAQIIGLFKALGQKVPINADGKESVDYEALQGYINENPTSVMVGFVDLLFDYKELGKLISTYGETLIAKIDNGYLHGQFNQLGTDTGRLSSSSPNLQNIPAHGIGRGIRRCFVPDLGQVMITCDMQAAEVRLAADFSGDTLLTSSILDGVDMHSKLASVSFSIIFGTPFVVSKSTVPVMVNNISVIPAELRDVHKSATFCKFYKGGPKRIYGVLSRYINMFHKKGAMGVAKQISDALDAELIGLSRYLDNTIKEANRTLKLRGRGIGRVRYFDKTAYGEAANFGIQNANAEAIKIAMIDTDTYLTTTGYGRLVMSIHDELVCSVKREHAEEAAKEIGKIMSNSLGKFLTKIPGEASTTIQEYWSK